MKVIIENKDIVSIRESLDALGLDATDSLITALIESSTYLQLDLIEETSDYENLHDAIINFIKLRVKNKDGTEYSYSWPTYGDSEKYTKNFYPNFAKRAAEYGFAFVDGVDNWIEQHNE